MQIIEGNPSIAGRIGAGFGKGLAEQLPKEIERGRLSSGLKNLKQKAEGGASPLDLLTDAYTIPGLSPEQAQGLLPYLQSAGLAGRQQKTAANIQKSNGTQPTNSSADHKAFRRLGTQEGIQERGIELHRNDPLLYPTAAAGIQGAENEYNRQQSSISKIDTDFDKVLGTKLQKGGAESFSDVLGELQDKYKNKAYDDVTSGKMTEKEAVNKYSKEALDFAKSRQNLKNSASRLSWFTPGNQESVRKKIDSIRDQYAKAEALESFADDLMSYNGLSDAYANSYAYPVKDNEGISKALSEIKGGSIFQKGSKKPIENFSKAVIDNITPDDSLWSIALELKNKGIDEKAFFQEIRDLKRQNKINLSDRQARELEKGDIIRPTLGDIYTSIGTGKFSLWRLR